MNKKIIYTILILVLLVAGIRFFSGEDGWMCNNGEWIKHGNPSAPAPDAFLCGTKNILENYLKNNISQISPEKEVLGGKFYITNLTEISSDTAEVEYEDGHIALRARFNFKISNGEVSITNFTLIK